jgi:hypothetical protein
MESRLLHATARTGPEEALGRAAAAPFMRLTRSVVVEILPASGVDFLGAPLILLPVVLIARLRPALKAANIDPVEVVRTA